jgi:carbon monoxide dehydrogenase subunit G
MITAHVTDTVNAPAETVWQILSDFGGIKKVFPGLVESCVSEGQGLGSTRDIRTTDGDTVFETMSKYDESTMTFGYTVDSGTLPLKNYEATVVITGQGDNACRIDWSSEFETNGLTEEETIEFLCGLYKGAIAGVKDIVAADSAAAE